MGRHYSEAIPEILIRKALTGPEGQADTIQRGDDVSDAQLFDLGQHLARRVDAALGAEGRIALVRRLGDLVRSRQKCGFGNAEHSRFGAPLDFVQPLVHTLRGAVRSALEQRARRLATGESFHFARENAGLIEETDVDGRGISGGIHAHQRMYPELRAAGIVHVE